MHTKITLSKASKTCLLIITWVGMVAACANFWIEVDYLNMPTQPSGKRIVELHTSHNHMVFVTQREYDKYRKYSLVGSYGIKIAVSAGIVFALLMIQQRKAGESA